MKNIVKWNVLIIGFCLLTACGRPSETAVQLESSVNTEKDMMAELIKLQYSKQMSDWHDLVPKKD